MIQKMLDAGAISFLMEGVSATELAQAIRSARNGNSMLSLEIQDLLRGQRPCVLGVLRIAINGALNNAEIARELTISLSTTKFHVSSILTKLGVCSRPEARP